MCECGHRLGFPCCVITVCVWNQIAQTYRGIKLVMVPTLVVFRLRGVVSIGLYYLAITKLVLNNNVKD